MALKKGWLAGEGGGLPPKENPTILKPLPSPCCPRPMNNHPSLLQNHNTTADPSKKFFYYSTKKTVEVKFRLVTPILVAPHLRYSVQFFDYEVIVLFIKEIELITVLKRGMGLGLGRRLVQDDMGLGLGRRLVQDGKELDGGAWGRGKELGGGALGRVWGGASHWCSRCMALPRT